MKKEFLSALVLALVRQAPVQDAGPDPHFRLPVTIAIFTGSIGLSNFRFTEGQTNLGFRIGTEFYYKSSGKDQRQTTPQICDEPASKHALAYFQPQKDSPMY